jgi:hypothetical protein
MGRSTDYGGGTNLQTASISMFTNSYLSASLKTREYARACCGDSPLRGLDPPARFKGHVLW